MIEFHVAGDGQNSFLIRVYNVPIQSLFRGDRMFFTPDGWLGFGVVVFMCAVVVGFATGVGKVIIWLFGVDHGALEKRKEDTVTTVRAEIHDVA